MRHFQIVNTQSDELTALFLRSDASLAIVEGDECWLADDIDVSQFTELVALEDGE